MKYGDYHAGKPLTGILFKSDPGTGYDLHGFVRIMGAKYKLMAYRNDHEDGRSRWALRLVSANSESEP